MNVGVLVKIGPALKTAFPVPVSSESELMRFAEAPVVVMRLSAPVKSVLFTLSDVTLRLVVVAVPLIVRPVAPVPPPIVDEAFTEIPIVVEGERYVPFAWFQLANVATPV